MVSIRLTRTGRKDAPSYRIVVVDKTKPRETEFIDYLGHYNPRTEPSEMKVDIE